MGSDQWEDFLSQNEGRSPLFDGISFVVDFILAVVAIISFQGEIQTCCGKTQFDVLAEEDDLGTSWLKVVQRATFAYPVLLVLELYPVLVKHIPMNVINPFIGYFLTLATFFENGRNEALALWTIEAFSIFFQYIARQLDKTRLEGEGEEEAERRQRGMVSTLIFTGIASAIILVIIVVVSQRGGICVTDNSWSYLMLNDSEGFGSSDEPQCGDCTGSEFCEICNDEMTQCFIPYAE